jgi:hypothetical protein
MTLANTDVSDSYIPDNLLQDATDYRMKPEELESRSLSKMTVE